MRAKIAICPFSKTFLYFHEGYDANDCTTPFSLDRKDFPSKERKANIFVKSSFPNVIGSTGSFREERNPFTGLNMLEKQQGSCLFNLVKIGFEYALSNAFSDLGSIYSQQNIEQGCEPMARESDDIYMSMESAIMRATVCLHSAYCCWRVQ
ncbi:hypothetical protein L1987_76375 [Smallanthus sonchifolius]|uniref:Uncharacterized protein n=1 Tax=Smallanthus sonchifolius TaxID=185202 RepID=A0ACB9A8J7_9ASTR|nr:hypothetical protein L1987_76375 [Smallanthus sonchifolius]